MVGSPLSFRDVVQNAYLKSTTDSTPRKLFLGWGFVGAREGGRGRQGAGGGRSAIFFCA